MTAVDRDWLDRQVAATPPPPVDSDAVSRMWQLLRRCAPGFAAVKEGVESTEIIVPRRGLNHDEAGSFLRAVDAGLVAVDSAGYFTVPTFMPKSPPGRYALFSRSGNAVSVNLEYVIQAGAAAELVLDQGHPAAQVGFERGEFDAVVVGESERPSLAMEAKARVSGPDSLEQLVLKWIGFMSDPSADLANNAGRKWRELGNWCSSGPVLVWLVADSARWSLVARLDDGRLVLEVG